MVSDPIGGLWFELRVEDARPDRIGRWLDG